MAAVLTLITGALALLAPLWLAAALGVINTLVLSEQTLLEQKVELLDSTECLAVLNGLVSSTAVTVAVGRVAQHDTQQRGVALQASLLSGAVSYVRVLALVWLIHPSRFGAGGCYMLLLGLAGVLLSVCCGPRVSTQAAWRYDVWAALHVPFALLV